MTAPAAEPAERARMAEVDLVKAVAIVTVVWIHAQRSPWDAGVSAFELWLGNLTVFAVPAFLAASGYLYASLRSPDAATTRRRVVRILAPYLVASMVAQGLLAMSGSLPSAGRLASDLLLGASFGIYYYVPQITLFVLASPFLMAIPRASWPWLVTGALVVQGAFQTAVFGLLPIFWHIRNPLLWAAYFVVGWWAGAHRAQLESFLGARRVRLVAALAATVVALVALGTLFPEASIQVQQAARWAVIYMVIAMLFALGTSLPRTPHLVQALSDATYAIYLWHFFFVLAVRRLAPAAPGTFEAAPVAAAWGAGVLGSLMLVAAARRLLGARSRYVIGA